MDIKKIPGIVYFILVFDIVIFYDVYKYYDYYTANDCSLIKQFLFMIFLFDYAILVLYKYILEEYYRPLNQRTQLNHILYHNPKIPKT